MQVSAGSELWIGPKDHLHATWKVQDLESDISKTEYQKNQLILLLGNLKQLNIIQKPIKILYLTMGSKLVVTRSISTGPN